MSADKTKDKDKEAKGAKGAKSGQKDGGKDAGKENKGQKEARPQQKEGRPQGAPKEGRDKRQDKDAPEQKEQPKERRPERPAPVPRLQIHYKEAVVKQLMEQFGYKTSMQVPRIQKIVLNMGVGEAVADKKVMDSAVADMTKIAGQKPVVTAARKSIAVFKVRSGYPVGCKVTLRGRRMYEFLDRLVSVAMPRIRDFRGMSGRAFDGQGNYNMGVKEQIIFPEIEYDKIDAIRGMNITIATTAKSDNEAKALLQAFRFPFRN
jgi:large subunit ribosomal protein L5